jgi:16S rRNA processing protein RimM
VTTSRSTSSSSNSTQPGDRALLLEVGHISKAHGVRGEVIVVLITDRAERVAPGSVLQTDRGPLAVRASRPSRDRWIVAFEGFHDRDGADALRGTVLRAEPIEDPDEWWVHELIGAKVVTVAGVPAGVVASVQANPASDLLVLDGGALVPVVFVVEHRPGHVVIDPPEGLLELDG